MIDEEEAHILKLDEVMHSHNKEFGTLSKKEIRAIIMIQLLSDNKRYNQTELKDKFNALHKDITPILWAGANKNIVKWAVWYSGNLTDTDVSRITTWLEKKDIIERVDIKGNRGAHPVLNRLKSDYTALFNILNLLKESKLNHIYNMYNDLDFFLTLALKIINSEYGDALINYDFIDEIFQITDLYFTSNEKEIMFQIFKISPTALMNQLIKVNSQIILKKLCEDQEFKNETEKLFLDSFGIDLLHLHSKESVFKKMIVDLGYDASCLPLSFEYSISVDLNVKKGKKFDPIYKINSNNIKVTF